MRFSAFPIYLMLALAPPVLAQTADEFLAENPEEELTESEIAEQEAIEEDSDGSLDDATNSIAAASAREGVGLRADVRIGYAESEIDNRDGSDQTVDTLRARWRVRADIGLTRYFRAAVRLAGICSSEECSPNPVIYSSLPTTSSIADGDITLDELYFHLVRFERFDLALGRMQTKFVARGGVFAKSLDRNDSNATNVNWTDGLHATFQSRNGWEPHLILQYNSSDGASNVRRTPLNFEDSSARVSYFLGFENLERKNLILQRAMDVSYLPKSLLKDGELSGRREDYYGIVVRGASRWPKRDDGPRLRLAGEIGYAPETQTSASSGLAGDGDTDGLGWNIALSLMEFKPDHSIGINYGQVGAGWLLSPQFRPNESLTEIRYQWRRNNQLAFDFRIRKRKELEQLVLSDRKREELDFFLRLTWGKTIR